MANPQPDNVPSPHEWRQSVIPDELPVLESDLTDDQWYAVSGLLCRPPQPTRGRPQEIDLRALLNGILYHHSRNCSWRNVPKRYGTRSSLNNYYHRWSQDGTLHRVAVRLRIAELQPLHDELMWLHRYDAKLSLKATSRTADKSLSPVG
ncbi:transposase [Candidatus Laterigemmans baculatus]|uniref:transposase n=1 Tax=Candidatus Laterigemmans baculatus TaxID=2770505 RepID=UPI0013DB4B92|nr:transposase [Candidatus Laterigemmans baculatus]